MLNLDIAFLDGTSAEVLAVASDFVRWEAKYDLSVARFNQDMKLTHLMFLGWSVLKRTKQTEVEFEEWVDLVQGVTVIDSKKSKG
jgi:hypothetical protein